jgi:two-component system phosphate regulon sensor histidine kinase PhoR
LARIANTSSLSAASATSSETINPPLSAGQRAPRPAAAARGAGIPAGGERSGLSSFPARLPGGIGTLRSSLLWRSYLITFPLIGIAAWLGGWQGALAAIVVGAGLLYWNIRGLLVPWAAVTRAAQALTEGSRDHRLETDLDEEAISRLGEALHAFSGDLAQRLRAIAEDRHRLETVLSATLEGVVSLDEEGSVTLMNRAAQEFLTLAPDECLGRPFHEVCRIPRLVDFAKEAIAASELRKTELKEGGKTLEVYATPLGSGIGVVLVIHDLTEVRRLEAVRRDFVANVSHELKTPLTSIRGYVETLIDGGLADGENNLRFLKKIEAHSNRLAALITDLLSLSRIESGDALTQRLRINLTEFVVGAYQRLSPNAEAKGVEVCAHAADPMYMLGDPEALQQILDNLIDNAIKYNRPDGRVDLYLTREKSGGAKSPRLRIDVKDTGVGIPHEDLPRIFERFYRVDKARSGELGGTGLGLSIVKHLVQALHGEIQVESRMDAGSTFTVWFPEASPDEE